MVDGLGTKLDPLALDEDGGADLERQIGGPLREQGVHKAFAIRGSGY